MLSPQTLVLVSAVVTLLLTAVAFPFYIDWLKRKQIGQNIREEGPQSHAVKAKTPTMGGLCFIFTSILVSLNAMAFALAKNEVEPTAVFTVAVATLLIGVACGLVGFADDYAKVTSGSNRGLSAKNRLLAEFGLGALLSGVLLFCQFSAYQNISILVILYLVVVGPFLVASTSNALNLHDGMDGLAGGTSIQVFIVLAIMLTVQQHFHLALIAASVAGGLGAFLLFNKYPAKVFMGDTGSLFLGGLMAALVAASGLVLWFIPLALIYILETLSVIAQVVYFKLTKPYTPDVPMSLLKLAIYKLRHKLPGDGKRLFRMAPLHHHYEAIGEEKGIPEWKVVSGFWVAQLVVCTAVLVTFLNVPALRDASTVQPSNAFRSQ